MITMLTKDNKQLIIFFILCILSFLFIQLADIVMDGAYASFDEQIVLMFRNVDDLSDPIGPKWVEELMRDTTALGGVGILVFISFVVLFFLMIGRHKKIALVFFVSVTSGLILSFSLKYGFTRPRPDFVPHVSYVYTSSFPSGHALMSSLIYLTIAGMLCYLDFKRSIKTYFFIVAIILTLAIGVSRIYLGVHYITDVIGGWILGSGWALLSYFWFRYLMRTNWLKEYRN